MTLAGIFIALVFAASACAAEQGGRLLLPAATLERTGDVPVVYELDEAFTGHVTLRVRWTDSLGRVAADRTIAVDLVDETRIKFTIDMTHAVAMKNRLHATLTLAAQHIDGPPTIRQESAEAEFVARPPYVGWNDYVVMMWQPYPSYLMPALKKLGVNAGQYSGRSKALPDFLIDNNMRWYSESVAPEFYAEYHRWRPDRPKNWAFTEAKKRYREAPDSLAAFKRDPGLQDPDWRRRVHDRAVATAKRNAPYWPYFYSLADEPGIAELEAQWDFGFSEESLTAMRHWLRREYASLDALNEEWGTHFPDWDQVVPLTTNQAMSKRGNNFAAWADFKTWMDISFAEALKLGADAIREGDPKAYVGIGGGQKPGWGGYDYARITHALTAIEAYDIGRSVDIIHSLDPNMPMVSTAFAPGPWEKHRVWHELLHGNRGLIIWDSEHSFAGPNRRPSPAALQASQYYNEIRNGIGALLINSHVINDRIAIHYSQPSLRTQWMLERRPDGDAWMTRSASYERTQDQFMRVRESWCNLIEDQGMQHNFVSYAQLEQGELHKRGYPVLVLPQSSSLSPTEANAIRDFVAAGGIAIADSVPGTYDQHSRQLTQSSLADLFGAPRPPSLMSIITGKPDAPKANVRAFGKGKAILLKADIAAYLQDRLEGNEQPLHRKMEELLRTNGVQPQFVVEDEAGHAIVGLDLHVFANGDVRILTLQSNPQLRVNELGPPDFRSNERFEKPITAHLRLPNAMHVYNTRTRTALGKKQELTLTVDPYEPTILAVSNAALPSMQVSVPEHVQRGSRVAVAVQATPAAADISVFNVEVRDPRGKRALYYSGNLIAQQGTGVKFIPLAANDLSGQWHITVHDMLSGQTIHRSLVVE